MTQKDYQKAVCLFEPDPSVRERVRAGLAVRAAAERGSQPRRAHPLRAALIAAAVCLALVGTVFAAGWELPAFIRRDISSDSSEMFSIDSNSLVRYSWSDLAVEYKGGERTDSNLSSWEAAEQYLGLDMSMSQTLVEKGIPQTFHVYQSDSGGDPETYNCHVQMEDKCIVTEAAYRMERWYTCIVNSFVAVGPDYIPVWIVRGKDITSTVFERYVTSSGLEAGIISDQNAYWAVFVRDGIGYYVRISWNNTPIDGDDSTHGVELLKEILDGFTLE